MYSIANSVWPPWWSSFYFVASYHSIFLGLGLKFKYLTFCYWQPQLTLALPHHTTHLLFQNLRSGWWLSFASFFSSALTLKLSKTSSTFPSPCFSAMFPFSGNNDTSWASKMVLICFNSPVRSNMCIFQRFQKLVFQHLKKCARKKCHLEAWGQSLII